MRFPEQYIMVHLRDFEYENILCLSLIKNWNEWLVLPKYFFPLLCLYRRKFAMSTNVGGKQSMSPKFVVLESCVSLQWCNIEICTRFKIQSSDRDPFSWVKVVATITTDWRSRPRNTDPCFLKLNLGPDVWAKSKVATWLQPLAYGGGRPRCHGHPLRP